VESCLREWKKSLGPKPSLEEQTAEALAKLSSREFGERARATRALVRMGAGAVPALRRALPSATGEAARRLTGILARLEAPPDEIAAKVNGEPLTWSQVKEVVSRAKEKDQTAAHLAQTRRSLCEGLLVWQAVDRKGIDIPSAELEAREERDRVAYGGREEFEKVVRIRYGTLETYREECLLELASLKLYQVLAGQLIPDPEFADVVLADWVSADEERQYFESHRDQFRGREEVSFFRIGVLFRSPEEEAQKREVLESVLRKLGKGAEFAMLAYFYSDVRRAKDFRDRGVTRGDLEGVYSPDTIRYLFEGMKEGDLSPIVKDGKSLNIFRMEHQLRREDQTFDEARDEIRSLLEKRKREENRKDIVAALKRRARVDPRDVFEDGDK
jgi:hypothetical protein